MDGFEASSLKHIDLLAPAITASMTSNIAEMHY